MRFWNDERITRNMVMGRAYRLKLKWKNQPSSFVPGSHKARRPSWSQRPSLLPAVNPHAAPAPAPEPVGAHRCDLLALTNESCRWPVTAESPHFFCGEPTADMAGGRVYCDFHAKRSTDKSRDYGVAA